MLYYFSNEIIIGLPEIFFLTGLLSLLLWALHLSTQQMNRCGQVVTNLTYLLIELHLLTALLLTANLGKRKTLCYSALVSDNYVIVIKLLLIGCTIVFLSLVLEYVRQRFAHEFEVLLLIAFVVFASFIVLASNDLVTLYLGIEAQSLCLYVLASMKKTSQFSSEAGLKYFILGALSSSLLLFGMSFVYGITGSTNFDSITKALVSLMNSQGHLPTTLIVGFTCILCSLLFKIAAVPFHVWSPDVYEGAPLPIMIFFATVPKLALVCLLVKVLYSTFWNLHDLWQPLLTVTAAFTIIFSSLATLYQKKIKRFLAYSSINHIGYMLIGLSTGTLLGVHAFFLYVVVYLITMFTFFGLLLALKQKTGKAITYLTDLLRLQQSHPLLSTAILIALFSIAGIPPLVGFFSKFYIFLAAVDTQSYILAVISMLCSTLSAFYYLRIIKILYFERSPYSNPLNVTWTMGLYTYIPLSLLILGIFFIAPNFLFTKTYYLSLLL